MFLKNKLVVIQFKKQTTTKKNNEVTAPCIKGSCDQPLVVTSNTINMWSEASRLILGATFNRKWIQARNCPINWYDKDITVTALELYLMYSMLNMFHFSITNTTTVVFLFDNIAMVNIINKQSS